MAAEYFMKALAIPSFDSLDEILLLKDYGIYLKNVIRDDSLSDKYFDLFYQLKEQWEDSHDTVVEYPKYKSRKCEDITSADYGYTL